MRRPARPAEASTRPTTRTPRVTKASSTSGRATRCSAALTPLEWSVFSRRFGFDEAPNFEGAWHPHVFVSIEQIAKELQLEPAEVERRIDARAPSCSRSAASACGPDSTTRSSTSWNALAIRGLAIAARVARQPEFAAAAERALEFMRANLWRERHGCWPRRRTASRISMPTSTTTPTSPMRCSRCCSSAGATKTRPGCARSSTRMLAHFEDPQLGGFFFTSDDHETLIHRSKSFSDDAIPAGNGIAARALIRAGYLLGETRWLERRRAHAARRLARHQSLSAWPHEPARSARRVSRRRRRS